jgi:hypothetical protein
MIKEVQAIDFSSPTVNPVANVGTFATLMNVIAPLAMAIGAFICLAMLFWGGFLYLTSGGEADKVQQGKRTLTYAIIGLIILICSTLFVNVIALVLGVPSFFAK